MKYFKIITGYDKNQFVPIDETELETAYKVFMNDGKAVFKEGVVRGKDIVNIVPDWNRTMGWNQVHQLDADDWNDIKAQGVEAQYKGILEEKRRLAVDNSNDRLQLTR